MAADLSIYQSSTSADNRPAVVVVKSETNLQDNAQGQVSAKRKTSMDHITKDKKKLSRSKSKNGTTNSSEKRKLVGQLKSPEMVQAEQLQQSLGTESPSFVKMLVKSNVDGSFSVTLPAPFSRSHLPTDETTFTFEDESGGNFEVKYIPKWTGLSGGWRKFALSRQLRERDVLVFHLVEPTKFKVYIVRANDSTEANIDPSTSNPDAHAKQNEQGGNVGSDSTDVTDNTPLAALKIKKTKPLTSLSQSDTAKKNKKLQLVHQIDQPAHNNGRSESSEAINHCKGLESFEDFQIKVNGLCLESEVDENTLKKYYELCCCKNDILHNHVFSGLNTKLLAGIISETVNVADAIKACNFTTSREELEQWENSLKSFKLLGMNVEFLLDRVSMLLRLGLGYEGNKFEDEMKKLKVKRIEYKEAYEKLGVEIEELKSKAERQELKLRLIVNSPW